jgi:hypothetical protein
MKKIVIFIFASTVFVQLFSNAFDEEKHHCFSTAFTAGYVFKHNHDFKQIYGHGVINVITADGCYYPLQPLGVGAKISYWRKHGRTTFLRQCSLVQEVPVTIYLRGIKDFNCGLGLYGSLGGGFIWLKEKSYLGNVHLYKGIGEVEVGLHYCVWHCINVTGAFRYLFPPQSYAGEKIDVGGSDLRAGIAFVF